MGTAHTPNKEVSQVREWWVSCGQTDIQMLPCFNCSSEQFVMADVPFARLDEVYNMVIHHLKGPKANQMREESNTIFCRTALQFTEDDMAAHLTAWSQCGFIPAFTSRNKKAFEGCTFRPDFAWKIPDLVVMLECDENAHTSYDKDKEYQRMMDLMDHAGQKRKAPEDGSISSKTSVVFIRINPSLPGVNSQLKHTMLLKLLMSVFDMDKTYVCNQRVLVHMFYPNAPHIWHTKCPAPSVAYSNE